MSFYLSLSQAAVRLGLTKDEIVRRRCACPPEPDATIGSIGGWLPETLDAWDKIIPGPGAASKRGGLLVSTLAKPANAVVPSKRTRA